MPPRPGKTEKKPGGHAGADDHPQDLPSPISNWNETLLSRFANFDSQRPGPDDAPRQAGEAHAHQLSHRNQKTIAVFNPVAPVRFDRDHSRESIA